TRFTALRSNVPISTSPFARSGAYAQAEQLYREDAGALTALPRPVLVFVRAQVLPRAVRAVERRAAFGTGHRFDHRSQAAGLVPRSSRELIEAPPPRPGPPTGRSSRHQYGRPGSSASLAPHRSVARRRSSSAPASSGRSPASGPRPW